MSEPENKRKKPNYFLSKKHFRYILHPGLKGFLCTCNFREKECIQESYNILNTFADKLNAEIEEKQSENVENTQDNSDDEDISKELSKEINTIKSENQTNKKRFQVVETKAKNIIFIRTTLKNPIKITDAIFEDILTTKQQQTRFLMRLLPIEITCKANMDDIKKSINNLIENHFSNEPKTYAINFNHRNNNQLKRDAVIEEIASLINNKSENHKVDLKNAELTIIVEIIAGVCLLSVVPDYIKRKKYNLLQFCESLTKNPASSVEANCVKNE